MTKYCSIWWNKFVQDTLEFNDSWWFPMKHVSLKGFFDIRFPLDPKNITRIRSIAGIHLESWKHTYVFTCYLTLFKQTHSTMYFYFIWVFARFLLIFIANILLSKIAIQRRIKLHTMCIHRVDTPHGCMFKAYLPILNGETRGNLLKFLFMWRKTTGGAFSKR